MSENEAKGVIPYMENSTHTETCEKCLYIKSQCKCKKSEINAGFIGIKEAQEYLLNRYLVVGSPVNPPKEECEKHNAVLDIAIQALEEIQKIKALGDCYIIPKNGVWEVNGVDIYKAIEKQIPKKPDYQGENEKCPSCGSFHVFGKHCTECGQAVDYD